MPESWNEAKILLPAVSFASCWYPCLLHSKLLSVLTIHSCIHAFYFPLAYVTFWQYSKNISNNILDDPEFHGWQQCCVSVPWASICQSNFQVFKFASGDASRILFVVSCNIKNWEKNLFICLYLERPQKTSWMIGMTPSYSYDTFFIC